MQDRRMVAILIEFSGGINANSGRGKESKDLDKLLPAMKQVNEYKDISYPIPVFCIRFSGKTKIRLYSIQQGK